MVAKPTSHKKKPDRYKAEALRACLAYTMKDATALGLVTAALHMKLAIMEIDDALKPEPEAGPAN